MTDFSLIGELAAEMMDDDEGELPEDARVTGVVIAVEIETDEKSWTRIDAFGTQAQKRGLVMLATERVWNPSEDDD